MKITCTEDQKEWLTNLMVDSNTCGLECPCRMYDQENMKAACRRCIEENVEFEIEENEK